VTADGDAAIAVSVVAEGNDPLDGARAVERSTKSSVVNQTRTLTINGLPAAETHLNANAKTGIDLIWIAYRGQIYQLAGVAPVERSEAFRGLFVATARSFRPLSADDLAGLTETRIRLVRAHTDETLDALAGRSHSAWTKDEIAVANGLSVDQRLKKDLLVKVSIAEPYEQKRAR
jgi:predicted Zn-dependent protease